MKLYIGFFEINLSSSLTDIMIEYQFYKNDKIATAYRAI